MEEPADFVAAAKAREAKGTDLFPAPIVLRSRPPSWPIQDAFPDPLLDLEDEGLRARELIAIHRCTDELEFVFVNPLGDKLPVSLLPPFRSGVNLRDRFIYLPEKINPSLKFPARA